MPLYALGDRTPSIDPTAFVHPDAVIIGDSPKRCSIVATFRCMVLITSACDCTVTMRYANIPIATSIQR